MSPPAHVTSRWQRALGRIGIPTHALCGARIVARRATDTTNKCSTCQDEAHWLVTRGLWDPRTLDNRLAQDSRLVGGDSR